MSKKPTQRKYHLTNGERDNLLGRKKMLDYLSFLVNKDSSDFIQMVIKPRMGLKPEQKVKLSPDFEWLEYDKESVQTKN